MVATTRPVAVSPSPAAPAPPDPGFAAVLAEVSAATGVDFSGYKEETLRRRLQQRLAVLRLPGIEDYLRHAHAHPGEWARLQQSMLVSLSSFFRNADSFAEWSRWLLPYLSAKPATAPIRLWVPGCATGEEVYTLAILLLEGLGAAAARRRIEVLGSDLNADALAVAEAAHYRPSAFKEVDPAVRARYFQQQGDGWTVAPEVRALCRFERSDVTQAMPGGAFAAISCRNLLIYLKTPLQDHLLQGFHGSLEPEGFLMLGDSEHLSPTGNRLFATLSYPHRVYRRRSGA